jgi:hypothetical protein
MSKFIFTESQIKKIIDHQIIQESAHHEWWGNLESGKQKSLMGKHFPDKDLNLSNTSNNEVKHMYDKEHSTDKKEFRPGVNLGKYNLKKLFIGDEGDDEDTKKPFSANKLRSKKD